MRLRRETGDFQIKITVDDGTATANSISKNLLAEDFVGQVVEVDGPFEDTFEVVTNVSEGNGLVTAHCASYILEYTKATGAINATTSEDGGMS